MSKHPLTSRDFGLITIVLLPLLIFGGMIVASMIRWRIEDRELTQSIESIVGQGNTIDSTTLPRLYDERTSDEPTATWKSILAATEAHNAKFGGPFAWESETDSYDSVVPPGEDWVESKIIARYAEDAQPIIDKIETLLGSDEAIWVPFVFEGLYTNLNEVQQMRGVARLLHNCFLDAVHRGNNDRAIILIQASERLFGNDYQPSMLVDELVRMACYSSMENDLRRSIAADVWSDGDREQIGVILSEPFDWDAKWRTAIESEMFAVFPTLFSDGMPSLGLNNGATNLPIMFAPSTLSSYLEGEQSIATIRGAGTKRHVDAVGRANKEWMSGAAKISLDRWMQIPSLDTRWVISMTTPAYEAFAVAFRRSANDHRFTRTVFALREFRAKFQSWPESLGELSRVGLPNSETQAWDDGPFAYHINQDGEAVIVDQARSDITYTDEGNPPERLVLKK